MPKPKSCYYGFFLGFLTRVNPQPETRGFPAIFTTRNPGCFCRQPGLKKLEFSPQNLSFWGEKLHHVWPLNRNNTLVAKSAVWSILVPVQKTLTALFEKGFSVQKRLKKYHLVCNSCLLICPFWHDNLLKSLPMNHLQSNEWKTLL